MAGLGYPRLPLGPCDAFLRPCGVILTWPKSMTARCASCPRRSTACRHHRCPRRAPATFAARLEALHRIEWVVFGDPPTRELQAEGPLFPKHLYKLRARIEQTIGKLKRFKRVAMRCDKTDISYSAIISFACGLMLVKSVHTA